MLKNKNEHERTSDFFKIKNIFVFIYIQYKLYTYIYKSERVIWLGLESKGYIEERERERTKKERAKQKKNNKKVAESEWERLQEP